MTGPGMAGEGLDRSIDSPVEVTDRPVARDTCAAGEAVPAGVSCPLGVTPAAASGARSADKCAEHHR